MGHAPVIFRTSHPRYEFLLQLAFEIQLIKRAKTAALERQVQNLMLERASPHLGR
jgi:hypothetical protein